MNKESKRKESIVANRVVLAFVAVTLSSLSLFVITYHAGIEAQSGFGLRTAIAVIGIPAVIADRIYVWAHRRK